MPLRLNEIVEIEVTGMSHEGDGIGRADGMAVFIPRTARGDRVRAKIIHVKKTMAFAKLLQVLEPSGARIACDCPVYGSCGGCAFRHVTYEEELAVKYRRVCDACEKIGHLAVTPLPVLGSPAVDAYRNKAQYPVLIRGRELIAGFYARGSHRVVPARQCLLQPECFSRALEAFADWAAKSGVTAYDEKTGKGLLRHIYLRQAHATGELMACAVVNGTALPAGELLVGELRRLAPETVSILLNVNQKPGNTVLGEKCVTLWGRDAVTDRFCGLAIKVSSLSFYQVNSPQAERLYAVASEFSGLTGEQTLLDLYCGTGTIGLSMAGRVKKLVGAEIVPEAVADAEENARRNGIQNAEFLCADAGEAARTLGERGLRPDVVIVDPPRKGLDRQTLDIVASLGPARIVYVSCDPATMARDAALLCEKGYRCEIVQPVDLFPRTAHVETVVLMSRVKD